MNRKNKRLFKENNTRLDDGIFVRGCPMYFLHHDDDDGNGIESIILVQNKIDTITKESLNRLINTPGNEPKKLKKLTHQA